MYLEKAEERLKIRRARFIILFVLETTNVFEKKIKLFSGNGAGFLHGVYGEKWLHKVRV